ncbi:MAG: sulfotransferase [Lewinella sp.]|nr:sulfotransferase [Lewinella sp.]
MSKGNTILHIGLMKTGSTFLQTRVFPNLEGIRYFHGSDSFYRSRSFSKGPLGKVLISNEGFTGSWYKERELNLNYFDKFTQALDNIREYFNDPKIIVVFREPSSFIKSSYKQYLNEGGTASWEEFIIENDAHLEQFKFSKYIKLLLNKVELDNLLILNYDQLRKNPMQFVEEMCTFIFGDYDRSMLQQIKLSEKSNPSVPDNFESWYIRNNRVNKWLRKKVGFELSFRWKKWGINLNSFIRYILPRIIKKRKKRDISYLEEYFRQDWSECLSLIESAKHVQ